MNGILSLLLAFLSNPQVMAVEQQIIAAIINRILQGRGQPPAGSAEIANVTADVLGVAGQHAEASGAGFAAAVAEALAGPPTTTA